MQLFRRQATIAVLAFLLAGSVLDAALAQPATPVAYPVAPDPAACFVTPVAVDEIVVILGTPVATPADSATRFVRPAGEPADAETSADVVATLYQVFACANAGDLLRVSNLFTDDFVRAFFGGVPTEDLTGFLAVPPQALAEEQKRVIIRFGEVQILPDGRAGVVIVLDEPDDPRTEEPDFAILEQIEGRWLVDEIHEDGGAAGTPVTGTPGS